MELEGAGDGDGTPTLELGLVTSELELDVATPAAEVACVGSAAAFELVVLLSVFTVVVSTTIGGAVGCTTIILLLFEGFSPVGSGPSPSVTVATTVTTGGGVSLVPPLPSTLMTEYVPRGKSSRSASLSGCCFGNESRGLAEEKGGKTMRVKANNVEGAERRIVVVLVGRMRSSMV
jgi:hypothetical protein